MKCKTCIYRKNCQFLGRYKKVEVSDCTAFVSEVDFIKKIKVETINGFAEKLKSGIVEGTESTERCRYPILTYEYIDNLVNEMLEQAKGE